MAKALKATLLLLALALFAAIPAVASAHPENSGGASGITAQQAAPSVSISAGANVQVRLNSPVSITATFSEPVSGFTLDDISVVNGTASGFSGSDGDSVYTFEVTPDSLGEVTVDIAAGVATDGGGAGNTAAPQLSLGIPYDFDGNGGISKNEAIAAVVDYFAGSITKAQTIAVIVLYFSSPTEPVPGSCGDGTYDTPVPVTGLLGGNKSPSWRPDCAEIAYVQEGGVSVMKPDGEHLRDLHRYEPGSGVAAGAANWTAWSPDGARLALAVENTGSDDPYWGRHIWVVEADGSNMVQLTNGPQWDNSPSWSPDGNQIVFQRSFFEDDSYIVTIDVDGSNETPLTAGSPEEHSPSWSPDGANIGYVTEHGQLALMAPDGSNRREIVANHSARGMSWSPDSSQIAYTRDLGECTAVVLINADGTDERRITYLPGDNSGPAWSPDGELLLFVNTIARGWSQIYIVSVHGGSRDGLEEGCAQVERYEPSQDVAAPYDWRSRLPQEAAPASALECRPPNPWPGDVSAGFPRPLLAPSVGKLRIAVLFVDFPDGVADYSTRVEAEHFDTSFWHQNLATIEKYLETASYGKLDVELVPLHGWLRARHSLAAFLFDPNLEYLGGAVSEDISVEAVELALAEMDFSEIDAVVTVLPSAYFYGGRFAGAVQISDKLIPTLQLGVLPRLISNDTAGDWGAVGTHELAHVLGLTDLYPWNQSGHQGEFATPFPPADMNWVTVEAGLMGLQGNYLAPESVTGGPSYQGPSAMLAWSRWQLGWLEPAQIRCIVEPSATVTLTAIDQPGDGVAMIAVPVGETEVIVIESRRDRGLDSNQLYGYDRDVVNNDGVLVYTVDSSVRELPIRFATDGGEGIMDQSPILPVGTSITVKGYEITVIEDSDDTHTVRVSKLGTGEGDRANLVALYNATGGPNWERNNNWVSDMPISEWSGVTTGDNGRVTGLDLYENQLSGEIPPELGNLANLAWLDLEGNQLRGEIPPELGNLANLRQLHLSRNQLSGEIPPELGNLANLTELYLYKNQLSGGVPPELGNFANLTELYLDGNQLSGEIPPELDNLANLTWLYLAGNQLSGEIPPELGNLANLEELYLSENQLSGEIPPELGNLANLKGLYLSENQLSGGIPPELGNLANLERLSLSYNQLTGEIPPELGNLANLKWLFLGSNQLSGEISPELGNLANLEFLGLGANQLSGCVPSSLSGRLNMDFSNLGGLPFCP